MVYISTAAVSCLRNKRRRVLFFLTKAFIDVIWASSYSIITRDTKGPKQFFNIIYAQHEVVSEFNEFVMGCLSKIVQNGKLFI